MIPRLLRLFWGDLSDNEIRTFGFLSIILFFIMGSYWIFLSLKDSLLKGTIGFSMQPMAKMAALIAIVIVLFIYAKLVDAVSKTVLFFIIYGTFAAIFFSLAYYSAHAEIGLLNTVITPSRKFGWVSYFVFECFGSLVIPLFWGFVSSFTTTDVAQRGFPLLIAGAQIGAIVGPTLVTHAETIGIPTLLFIGACGIALVPFLIYFFIRYIQPPEIEQLEANLNHKKGSSWSEGLQLVLTRPYLAGILGLVVFHQLVGTILAFQMKQVADAQYSLEAFAAFSGKYGQITNTFALFFIIFGTSFVLRKIGLTFSLILYPATMTIIVIAILVTKDLSCIYWGMVLLKGLGYALNNPAREIIYIPTSNAVKFKAKSWIDGFGARSAKAGASGLIIALQNMSSSVDFLVTTSSLISLGLLGCWLVVARTVGKSFSRLVEQNKIVD